MHIQNAIHDYSCRNRHEALAAMVPQLRENGGKDLYTSILIMKMLEQNDPEMRSALGDCYYQGTGVNADLNQALDIFKTAAAEGSQRAQYDLGWYYYDKEEYRRAIEHFSYCTANRENLSERQQQKSYSCLGDSYSRLSEPNMTAAIENLAIASEKYRDGYASRRLAILYEQRNARHFDPDKSVRYYELGAENGDEIAACQMGLYYIYGDEDLKVEKNFKKAEAILLPYAQDGDEDTLRALGMIYMRGDAANGVSKDYSKAKTFFERSWAIKQQTSVAADLGYVYYITNDYVNAEKMLLLAADAGNYAYADFLGRIYKDCNGFGRDLDKAVYYYERAYQSENLNNVFTAGEYAELLEELGRYEKAYDVADQGEKVYNDIWFVYIKAKLVITGKVRNKISTSQAADMLEVCIKYDTHTNEVRMLLGAYYLQAREYRKSEKHYLDAFYAGVADAAVYLGRLYENGGGTISPDVNKAYEWYQMAASAGSVLGQQETACFERVKKGFFGNHYVLVRKRSVVV